LDIQQPLTSERALETLTIRTFIIRIKTNKITVPILNRVRTRIIRDTKTTGVPILNRVKTKTIRVTKITVVITAKITTTVGEAVDETTDATSTTGPSTERH